MQNRCQRLPIFLCGASWLFIHASIADERAIRYIVQTITVIDSHNGAVLVLEQKTMPNISITGDRIEDCRVDAVTRAKGVLIPWWRSKYPYAFANVDCDWRKSEGNPT